jgi:hypothetical protein
MAQRTRAAVLAALAVAALSLLLAPGVLAQSSARRGSDESGVLTNLGHGNDAGRGSAAALLLLGAAAVGTALVLRGAHREPAKLAKARPHSPSTQPR